ncbi:unnamed protein product [Paramecium pentaurelia]|uniref:Dynein heavy chain n=1 Tax=Paramecium pentaurelia TaxID=43138 RepID=A0A8S1UZY2_9CILI|nr:unnamed protein product [Paramecium pentaurelia]
MNPRRAQSSGNRASSAVKRVAMPNGYTLYNQSGQKFHLPNMKNASQRSIEENENRAKTSTLQPMHSEAQTIVHQRPQSTIETPAVMMNKYINYRIAQPFSSTVDVNARLWEASKNTTIGLKRVSSAIKKEETEYQQDCETISGTLKPYEFLSSLGGKMISNEPSKQQSIDVSRQNNTQQHRPQTVTSIGKMDFTIIQEQQQRLQSAQQTLTRPPISKRPMTSIQRPQSQAFDNVESKRIKQDRIQSATLDVLQKPAQKNKKQFSEMIDQQVLRPQSNWSHQRPISSKTTAPQTFFKIYTKFTNLSALDLPYEELFDRNERTVAATFARFGDLGYYSPIQRIGVYMQFSAKLKKEHLLKIIDLQKTMSSAEKTDGEVPIQLAIVNELFPKQGRDKTGINSGASDALTREPVSLCLYPEYFDDNDENIDQMELSLRKFNEILAEMNGNYDPSLLCKDYYIHIDREFWPENILKEVLISEERYRNYISGDYIKNDEVPKFKREWILNAFNLIKPELLRNEECSRSIVKEILELFREYMKRAMLDYILRSPEERKRLHITLLPRSFIHSAQRIAREGGYNMKLFPDWHDFVQRGKDFCKSNLTLISTINQGLSDWIQDFSNFKLCDLSKMKQVARLGYTFTFQEFQRVQTIYKLNVLCLLEHVWFRGVMLIIKLQKFLRQKQYKSQWTITGPKFKQQQLRQTILEIIPEEDFIDEDNVIYKGEEYSCYISIKEAQQFYASKTTQPYNFDRFKDSCQALNAFTEYHVMLQNPNPIESDKLSQFQLEEIKQQQDEIPYKKLEKEQRKAITSNATVLLQLQLRGFIDRSLQHFEQHILNINIPKQYDIEISDINYISLIQACQNLKDREFIPPKWGLLSQPYDPFIRLELVIENEIVKLKENEESIKNEFVDAFRSIIISFDKFLHPKFAKVTYNPKEIIQSVPFRNFQFNFDQDMGGMTKEDFQKFFKSFWPQVKVEEKQQKEHPELLLASEEQKEVYQEKKYMTIASTEEGCYLAQEARILKHVSEHYKRTLQVVEQFQQFNQFFNKVYEKEIRSLKKAITNEEFKMYMEILNKYKNLVDKFPQTIQFPLFQVNCESVLSSVKQMIKEYKDRIFINFESVLIDQAKVISDRYLQISTYIRRSLKTPEDVEAMDKYITDVGQERVKIKTNTTDIFIKVMFLLKQDYVISEQLLLLSEELYHRPSQLDKELIEQEEKHQIERGRLEEELKKQRSQFEERVAKYCDEIHNFETFTERSKYKGYVKDIEEFEMKLAEAAAEMQEIIQKELTLFGYPSQFENFVKLQTEIQPYSEMWKSIGLYMENKKKWMNGPIMDVDYGDVETILKNQRKGNVKLSKMFRQNSIPFRVLGEFKEDVEAMSLHSKTLEVLSNPGLRERHWKSVQTILSQSFNYKEVSLRELNTLKVDQFINDMEEISENASKEFTLENALAKMKKEWDNIKLVVLNYKGRGVLILQGQSVEEIQTLLDDHVIKSQTIRANPLIKFMEEDAIRWEKSMTFIQQILELWIKVQGMYLYLEPIFSFEDIIKTLYDESEKFKKVSSNWNLITKAVEIEPLALNLDKIPNLMDILQTSLKLIEEIQKGLENHLEIKRLEFPRFFFLSNDDLINILAETRDPLLVQPHMRKCFEGIEELIFNSNTDILGMKSVEKEEVSFDNKVSPKEYKNCVERWLLKVEEEMRNSISHLIRQCYGELQELPLLIKWIRRWPGQCVLTCAQSTIKSGKTLNKYGNDRVNHLNEIVSLVRESQQQNERQLLSALIVLEVHNNDILQDLIKLEIKDTSIFEWTSQLRYYMLEDTSVSVKMVQTSIPYGNEYLGIGSRLVITPLTDRCYRTLVGALQLNLGGAPEGPAGTGKTESTKDLAKAVAVQCIVFNCGEGLNTHAMAKFFKGLASAGAWSCFDEFNRIELEVLSVIAQQILQIQQAKSMQIESFQFEGTEIHIQQSCNIFITMNPGYAGRSELPDNLKALFRPCAMMVPDYALIAEISLYSFGFVEARALAKKIVAVYKLCSEQLSSQDHYDYGMRAVKAVLTAAQLLKRKSTEREDILIYRAIGDINLPKFLTNDVMLFNGIMSDLFPDVKVQPVEYKNLQDAMHQVLQSQNMQIVPNFKRKVLQLYEMINCRHGLMLVGQTMSGKTSCYQVLASTLTYCHKNGLQDERCVQYHVLNPKSITLNQLYGYSDPVSKEWTEGVLGEIYRKCATSTSQDRQFLVFDGPVDAAWIENMNTVLDDNKKLCLMSGETIAMTDRMTIIFEVQDLTQASPATVSRCGMVYLQPDQLGWFNVFLKQLQEIQNIDQNILMRISDLFETIVDKAQKFIKQKCHEYESVPENSFCIHTLQMLIQLIQTYPEAIRKQTDPSILIDAFFIYSVVWTVGSSVDEVGRKHFDQYLKKLIKEPLRNENKKDVIIKIDKQSQIPELSNTNIYDFFYDPELLKWRIWKELLQDSSIPDNIAYQEILVETSESLRITAIIDKCINRHSPLLIIGPSGVGKTCYIRKHISQLQNYLNIFVNFSATTSANKTQMIIDSKVERKRKGYYGPPLGFIGLIYIDDMNMPAPDKYGTQAPLELIRQFFGTKGWYGNDRQFMHILDCNIIASMGLPGGGRSFVSQRLLRFFQIVSIVTPDTNNIVHIFTSIISWHLNNIKIENTDNDIRKSFGYAIEATIDLYTQIRDQLKATPKKSWYILNMRDISRIVQGMTLVMNAKELQLDHKKVQRLWLHETTRTFFDRLEQVDHEQYQLMLANSIKLKLRDDLKHMIKPYDDVATTKYNIKSYVWSDILSEEPNVSERKYTEVMSSTRVYSKLQYYLEDLNSNTKKPLNLALFDYCVDHLLRIQRVLNMTQGHLLLIGLGGSGRQSLTRMACFIREQEFLQIEVGKGYTYDQWKETMQKLMINAGADNKEITLCISDSQIKKPFILEDVNNLLNTGDIPNLFGQEDFIPQIDKLRLKAKKEGKQQLFDNGNNAQFYDYFIECVKKKLHVVMAMSPIGDTLRSRIRMFPSIVNCTTIDCFHQWPEDALEAVARKFLEDIQIKDSQQRLLVAQCKYMHSSLQTISEQFKSQEGRYNYVTPSSYFELLKTFQAVLHVEKTKLEDTRNMYKNGVTKLDQTQEEVKRMEAELIEKQPKLVEMNIEASKLAVIIKQQADAMEPKRLQVQQEEARVSECVKEAEIINQECEKELSVAKPKLKQAEEALNTLSPADINSIKAMLKPPITVKLVMESVCVLCGVPPISMPKPENPKERFMDYWEASKKFLADKDFLQKLIGYDKNNIKPEIMQKVRNNYISKKEEYNPKRVEKASSAAKGLCEWVLALDEYEKVLTIVRPKQEKYLQSQQEVARLQESLKILQQDLSVLTTEINKLEQAYQETINNQQQLDRDIKECEIKLQRATKLMEGLGGERERWSKSSTIYEQRLKQVLGDIILSSGTIAYLGVFSNNFRQKTIKMWMDHLQGHMQFSENFSLQNILGQPILIRQWRMNGLPSDQFSIENGIIMNRCQRFPLIIDPQGQGNRFIRQNEKDIKLVKFTDSDFLRTLENTLQFGQPLLIENVYEDIDSTIDSVLLKQIFKNAGVMSVRIGDNIIPYNKQFNLFMTTKLSNPHYTPEISTKVTIINFTITQSGLEDQLLEICVSKEQPNLEEEKNKQILQQHKNKQELQKIEDQILRVLNKAENILNDEEAIQILQTSKEKSKDIEEKQETSEYTERKIDEARVQYKPIAIHGALLFFAVISLAQLDSMYQYSLTWLLNLYQEAFIKSESSQRIQQRINNINNMTLHLIYNQVCRGLFEKDKLLYSFIILIKILELKKQIDFEEFSFIIRQITIPSEVPENPYKEWLPNQAWARVQVLIKVNKKLSQIVDSMHNFPEIWMELLNSPEGHSIRLPEPFVIITPIQRMCIIKALRPGKLPKVIQEFVASELGDKYTQPPPFSLHQSFQGSNPKSPLLFVLPGTDPMNALLNFAKQKDIQLRSVSLGQGQGVIAEKEIEDAKQSGTWVILQNCHLYPSWMPKLEKIIEDIQTQKMHNHFRLWLTSYPSEDLPASIVQSSVKMTNEPPTGIKSNLQVSYSSALYQQLDYSNKKLSKLFYALSFFHAILQERRNYGPIGFNIYYDFNQSDLFISIRQLQQMAADVSIPFYALHYLIGECNYGGRVTDERDRRVVRALLDEYLNEKVTQDTFQIQDFPIIEGLSYEEYLNQLNNLPLVQPTHLFGFHPNAEIMKDQQYTDEILRKLQQTLGSSYTDGQQNDESKKADNVLKQLCEEYLANFPRKFDMEIANAKYPHDYKNSFNTVFQQEITRFNKLISIIQQSFIDTLNAIKGLTAMSDQLEKITQSFLIGAVPEQWKKYSYPSLKPLASYLQDFFRRIRYFQNWLDKQIPYVHWISGFFFTQSFLTAVLQNHARKYSIAIDKLDFDFQFLEEPQPNFEINQLPRQVNDGTLIFGLFLEGCKWDYGREMIVESNPKVLTTLAPIIWLKPIQGELETKNQYVCPIYKTAERRGVLSTTGHSTNFIMNVNMPTEQSQHHWVKRGVAMLCQLSD